jgi:histidine ammonia-lyase
VIGPEKLEELQDNLIRSHSAGVGTPLTRERTRMLLALRVNVLSKGHSGISVESLRRVIAAFNADCISVVPSQGTVGASGDLAPLSHLALGLMGEGPMWDPDRTDGTIGAAAEIMARKGVTPIKLKAKEGLAMINGTQMIASLGAEACTRAANATVCADIAVAMSLEALKGTAKAFHPRIHATRPHIGQSLVASRLRAMLQPGNPSEIYKNHRYTGKVQDAYTLRCAPQIHGIAHDTVEFVRGLLNVELNSATDNPMVFNGPIGEEWVELGRNTSGAEPVASAAGKGEVASSSAAAATSSSSSSAAAAADAPASPPASAHNNKAPRKHAPVDNFKDLGSAKEEIERLRNLLASGNSGAGEAAEAEVPEWSMHKTAEDLAYAGGGGFVISGGNFHGEYPAKALDYLAIGISELASVSERRIERLW